MGIVFDYKSSGLSRMMNQMSTKIGAVILMYVGTKASEIESKMKKERPWTDRTSMAKLTLNVKVSQPNLNTVRMTLAHGVDYGMWLELAHGKNYAIIGPTLRKESPKIVEGLNGLMSKITL